MGERNIRTRKMLGNQIRTIKLNRIPSYQGIASGSCSFICKDEEIIKKITDREGVVLKVYFNPIYREEDFYDYLWGRIFPISNNPGVRKFEYSKLWDAIRIQNICSWYDLAPRIYEVVLLQIDNMYFPTVVTDFLEGIAKNRIQTKKVYEKISKLGEKYGFAFRVLDYGQMSNVLDGKLVDTEGVYFLDDYYDRMIERYEKSVTWSDEVYQAVPELGIKGWRGNLNRMFKFKEVEYYRKKVWDIGCSGGYFCRFASNMGASRVVGVDYESVIEGAREVSNYLGYFNIDWVGIDIKKGKNYKFGDIDPDIIFYLSVYRYLGYAPFLKRADKVFYEHNGDVSHETAINKFKKDFTKVKELGKFNEHDKRLTYLIEK